MYECTNFKLFEVDMKKLLVLLLVFGFITVIADDSLSYEELSECFLDFDVWAQKNMALEEASYMCSFL